MEFGPRGSLFRVIAVSALAGLSGSGHPFVRHGTGRGNRPDGLRQLSSSGSALDEDHKGVLADTVILHRCSICFTLHDCLESTHVGDLHAQTNSAGVLRVDEGANITRYRVEHLSAFGDEGQWATSSTSWVAIRFGMRVSFV